MVENLAGAAACSADGAVGAVGDYDGCDAWDAKGMTYGDWKPLIRHPLKESESYCTFGSCTILSQMKEWAMLGNYVVTPVCNKPGDIFTNGHNKWACESCLISHYNSLVSRATHYAIATICRDFRDLSRWSALPSPTPTPTNAADMGVASGAEVETV